jgi:hypothetical protein
LSQEVLLEHRAKVAASKREQHRKRQGEDEASNEKAAIKLYERERKRVAPPQKRKPNRLYSVFPCNLAKQAATIGGRPIKPINPRQYDTSYCYVYSRKLHSFVVSTQWIMCHPELQDRGTCCRLHADNFRMTA